MWTLQLDVRSALPFDGTTPLDLSDPDVDVDRSLDRTILVTLPPTSPLGRLDPGEVIELTNPDDGRPVVMCGFTVVSSGGPFISPTNELQRITPRSGAIEGVETLAALASTSGFFFDDTIFPFEHLLGILTDVAGPHRVVIVFKYLDDLAVSKLGCCDSGGGGGTDLVIEDEGIVVETATGTINFLGAGVSAASGGPGDVDVTIPGGSVPPLLTASFLDSATTDIAVGTDADGEIAVEGNLSQASGASLSFRADIAVSPTGAMSSVLEIQSDVPITSFAFSAVLIAGTVFLRLTGSGPGTSTTLNYRIVDTIPRALP